MKGTWQTEDSGGSGLLLLAGVAVGVIAAGSGAVAAAAELLTVIVIAVVVVVVLVLVVGTWLLVRAHRRGGLATVVYRAEALPAPEPRRVTAPPPLQVTNNFYGYSPAQVAEELARQAINGRTSQ